MRLHQQTIPGMPEPPPDAFDEFWKNYPKRVARVAAERAWRKLKPSPALQQQILNALELHKLSDQWQANKGQFIPYPASWLNGRRFEDAVTGTAATAARVEKYRNWRDECQRVHGGSCGDSYDLHEGKMEEGR